MDIIILFSPTVANVSISVMNEVKSERVGGFSVSVNVFAILQKEITVSLQS